MFVCLYVYMFMCFMFKWLEEGRYQYGDWLYAMLVML